MTGLEVGELLSGSAALLGVGGGIAAFYIRSTIAETIIDKLNGRYVKSEMCGVLHNGTKEQLDRLERKVDQLLLGGTASG